MTQTIGILTGGGDCPGLNAVIRGVVKSAIIRHGWRVLGIEDGFDGLLSLDKCTPLTLESVRGILPRGGTILGTTNRGNPFSYPVEQDGAIVRVDRSDAVVANIKALGIDALVAVGGEGSLKIALELYKKGIPVVGVPKTIDNDLRETDFTFGYNTALETATDALDKLHTTAESHHRVMILEVMGRYAGWIALESGIAGGADVILIPEIPFHIDRICDAVSSRSARGSRFSIIVVAEGAFPAGGSRVVTQKADERQAIERLGGIGQFVAKRIEQCLDMDVRVTVLGHLQRGGSPTTFDRALGSRFGTKAVQMVAAGEFGRMACLKGRAITSVPMEDAISDLKLVDPAGEIVQTAEELGIMLGR
ncbi:ATP-dependent 6-phosphofructokinase [Geobacter sp. FeAm09]|uniref:6-phosphofructokinase n=1 Tax=Geobacter sp. FeAm09 TaxID=2597769 RepID=UPI0011ED072C|nr:6-phosphofructokinase [Geobacter sp. FeAm09]QEM67815.1 ATP-dependent 6-phosphofructokinase [Geobacter sp. FeAm09]